ncbi:MAG TPA: hypothetical protein VK428_14255 [Acidimicrobiales bacterium]|nr:hypothetical protein [Acidimicrobiales bacterium]
MAKVIPDARLHECPGEGHWLVVDHMGEVLDVLKGASRERGAQLR